jgi:hypothetical protein
LRREGVVTTGLSVLIFHTGAMALLGMLSIYFDRVWIGNARDVRDIQNLYDHGINVAVDLAFEESPAVLPRAIPGALG